MSSSNLENFKETVKDMKEKMGRVLKMCDSTDFKINDALEILHDGLINIIDIKYLNSEVQKVDSRLKEGHGK